MLNQGWGVCKERWKRDSTRKGKLEKCASWQSRQTNPSSGQWCQKLLRSKWKIGQKYSTEYGTHTNQGDA